MEDVLVCWELKPENDKAKRKQQEIPAVNVDARHAPEETKRKREYDYQRKRFDSDLIRDDGNERNTNSMV